MKRKKLIIIGAGGHARIVIDTAILLHYNIEGIIDINYRGLIERILGYPVIGSMNMIDEFDPKKYEIFIAIGDNKIRKEHFDWVKDRNFNIPKIINPRAIISNNAQIEEGTLVNAGAIINCCVKINCNVIVNTGSIIDHETIIGSNTHIAPGVKIAGRCKIGSNTFVGIGAVIKDNIEIGDNCIIGAGSVVVNHIESNVIAYGVPAIITKVNK